MTADVAREVDTLLGPVVLPVKRTLRLTRRQAEAALLVRDGMTNKQIAKRMGTSLSAVKSVLHEAMDRLGMESRCQLAVWAERKLER